MPSDVRSHALPRIAFALLIALVLLTAPAAIAANLQAAERAFLLGDYETALREAEPLAAQGDKAAIWYVELIKAVAEAKRQEAESAAAAKVASAGIAAGKQAYDDENFEQAYRKWLPIAEAGNPEAQFLVGMQYDEGKGIEEDDDTAISFFLRAAFQGHPRAQYEAGNTLILRAGEIDNTQQALAANLLFRAATNGETIAYLSLAGAYCYGHGVEQNSVLADTWMTLALQHPSNSIGLLEGMQCEVFTPVTEEYRREITKRAEALRYAYSLQYIP